MLDPYTRIIVPVDGSENAVRAFRVGQSLAAASGLPLDLLHVHALHPGEAAGMAQISKADVQRAAADAGSRAFGALADEVPESGRHVLWGDAAEEILIFAEREGPALIVMGRGAESRLEHMLLGSVSDHVVRRAKGPVTLVP